MKILAKMDEEMVAVQIEYVDVEEFEIFRSITENALGVGRFLFSGSLGKQFTVFVGKTLICESMPQDVTRSDGCYNGEFSDILEKLKSLC